MRIGLCHRPTCTRLFDRSYVTFTPNLRLRAGTATVAATAVRQLRRRY